MVEKDKVSPTIKLRMSALRLLEKALESWNNFVANESMYIAQFCNADASQTWPKRDFERYVHMDLWFNFFCHLATDRVGQDNVVFVFESGEPQKLERGG